ncbi:S1/P1 nuclease [Algoriphagus sp. D3-2-R+10]|uniref:S1/P1 nuclease n=1 Tax=Algoriphagus aurantiacus TaxID=3103948 RepID=UPI002B3EB7C0|nr:S1/P1 nuclease [Algoriphagus sp. D3-2-R+10]MEB2774000.1 S1/P1 nuclease [Algoriphagus sp. D3-2-R+10]
MKKLLTTSFFVFLLASQTFAWGQLGHYLIGYMAEKQMKRSVRKKVEKVLYPMSIGRSGTWMDEIRSDHAFDYASSWHYMTSISGEYDGSIQEEGGNVYAEINRIKNELKAGNLEPQIEAELLKMLIHMVEDIHQPLHVGTGKDRGGNDVKLEYFGRATNLHAVWDSGIIDGKSMSYTEIGDELSKRVNKEVITRYRAASMQDWLTEAVAARPTVYNLPENKKISYVYGYESTPLLEERLIAASVRLAQILEEIYG